VTSPTNHWKIGLFVLLGAAIAMATVAYLGAQTLKKETVDYVTFFDESVQGLDLGSPVKFRGVTIGTVSTIDVAADQRHVAVYFDLGVSALKNLGLDTKRGPLAKSADTKLEMPADLRVQLASAGVTGVKFLQIDFFPVEQYPEPKLPFGKPDNYIPSAPSPLKNIEDSVIRFVNNMPELTDQLTKLLARINVIVGDIDDRKLPERVAQTLGNVDSALGQVQKSMKDLDTGKLSKEANTAIATLAVSAKRLDRILASAEKADLVGSVKRASDNVGMVADGANAPVEELDKTLRSVQEAADAIQRLADTLERDSDMLIKGRAKAAE
jgi:phospholipid/cholesterol/gamma-HCH transport system substrate-binding protein